MAFYSIDVSGHGIASALLTARLASYFSDGSPTHNIALEMEEGGSYRCRPPEVVADELNALLLNDLRSEHYFTMLFGYLDLLTGDVELAQCGHPNAVLLPVGHGAEFFGEGGMPIGLISEAEFGRQHLRLKPGERLIFYSDGFTECENEAGTMLDEEGFAKMLNKNTHLTNESLFDSLVWDLDQYASGQDLGDDLSCVMVSYQPHHKCA